MLTNKNALMLSGLVLSCAIVFAFLYKDHDADQKQDTYKYAILDMEQLVLDANGSADLQSWIKTAVNTLCGPDEPCLVLNANSVYAGKVVDLNEEFRQQNGIKSPAPKLNKEELDNLKMLHDAITNNKSE